MVKLHATGNLFPSCQKVCLIFRKFLPAPYSTENQQMATNDRSRASSATPSATSSNNTDRTKKPPYCVNICPVPLESRGYKSFAEWNLEENHLYEANRITPKWQSVRSGITHTKNGAHVRLMLGIVSLTQVLTIADLRPPHTTQKPLFWPF